MLCTLNFSGLHLIRQAGVGQLFERQGGELDDAPAFRCRSSAAGLYFGQMGASHAKLARRLGLIPAETVAPGGEIDGRHNTRPQVPQSTSSWSICTTR